MTGSAPSSVRGGDGHTRNHAASVSRASPVLDSLKRHWSAYLFEAVGLMMFMLGAGLSTTLFEHPDSPVRQAIGSGLLRHVLTGACMAAVTAAILVPHWATRSGGHINPALTWSFWSLGRIGGWDALFYTAAQFIGAVIAPVLLVLLLGDAFAHPDVKHATSMPGPLGPWAAWLGEFAITFLLMLTVLLCLGSKRLERWAGLAAAVLIGLYIAFESPLSGMSMNPARTFGSALIAGRWDGIWIYFTAPPLAALAAAALFSRFGRNLMADAQDGPHHPVHDPDKGKPAS